MEPGSNDRLDERVVDRRGLFPRREAIAVVLAPGDLLHQIEQAADAIPGVRERIEDEDAIASSFRFVDGVDEPLWVKRVEFLRVETEPVGVLAGRAMFGIEQGHGLALLLSNAAGKRK